MKKRVLYCGDGHLKSSGRYIYNLLSYLGFHPIYLPSHKLFAIPTSKPDVIILSDYPSARLNKTSQQWIMKRVHAGCSFLMLGGFGSYHGVDGMYQNTLLTTILPVVISSDDDRCHAYGGVTFGREWRSLTGNRIPSRINSPVFCGYNMFTPKPEARVILSVRHLDCPDKNFPLFVTGTFGKGKTGAYASDFSPHWCGGLVDWGGHRIAVKTPLTKPIEVGEHYITWFDTILRQIL